MIGVRQRRGQAFETMMLVISVIVAVAILGVLLGFLGGISFGATGAKDTIKSLVSKVYQRGIGIESAPKAEFAPGNDVFVAEVIGETPIQAADVSFYCPPGLGEICGSADKPLSTGSGGTSFKVHTKISAAISVCKGPRQAGAGGPSYYVCVGSTDYASDLADACAQKCGLTR
ncbi:MAG: hypothetical protein NTY90_02315 [Candidatus Micrarchaeota archaeon]|nr:hypothetical protein [Candidatus Micrarchaeota archaeon]